MNKLMNSLVSIFILIGCSSAPKIENAHFQLRPYQEETLENGLRLLFIEEDTLPIVNMEMLVKVGSLNESSGDEGVNFITAHLLEQGTIHKSAVKIADDLGQIAAEFQSAPGNDFTIFETSSLSTEKKILLELFSDLLMNPSFQSAEIERMRSQQLAAIKKSQDNPSAYTDQMMDRELFGKHPYATPVFGTEKTVRLFTRTDIMKHYLKYYRPNNAILSVTGKFDEEFKNQVRKTFSKWQKREYEPIKDRSVQMAEKGMIKLYTKAGLQQSQVRFAQVGLKRSDDDYFKLRMAFMILGGSFSSRLNQKIRDDLGLTYSIHSSVDARKENGALEISTFTRHDKLAETVIETKKLLKEFVEKGVSSSELDAIRALMSGQFPSAIETTPKLAHNLMILRFFGISDDYLKNYNANLAKITKDEVNEVIRRRFHPDQIQIIVYSDEIQVGEQLKKVGEYSVELVR